MFREEQQKQKDRELAEKLNAGRGHRKRKQTVRLHLDTRCNKLTFSA